MPKNSQLASILSYGSEGTVYSGTWQGASAAIKVMINQYARRAETEAKLVMKLNHPNIIKYFDLEYDQGAAYLSMELITGGNLYEFIQSRYTTSDYWLMIEQILREIAQGMAYLHDCQIVQGDLKSHNILLRQTTYQAVICDFGIARTLTEDRQDNKRSNTTKGKRMNNEFGFSSNDDLGTIRWMAPELCTPPPERSSFASDVWAYGCIILESTSAREPWSEHFSEDMAPFRALQRRENAPIFARICADQKGPLHLRQLLIECCAWSKTDRPRFIDILQRFDHPSSPIPPPPIVDNDITMEEFPVVPSPSLSAPKTSVTQPKSHGGRLTGEVYTSKGSASGRPIYEGAKGGRYYLTPSGTKVYLHK